MASRFPPENRTQLRARKGHDMKWSCDKHSEPIAFYCKKHDIPICHRCATKDHGQKPCELDDIEDVILERMRGLDDKQQEIEETKKFLKMLDSKIESSATSAIHHLQKVNGEVQSTYEEKSKSVKDKEEKKIRLINEEADQENRIINEKRDRRIKACNAEIEKQQQIIEESQAKLFSEIKAISEEVSKKITDLKSKNQHDMSTLENIDAKIKRIKQDDKTIVDEAPTVLATLEDNLNGNIHQHVSDCLDQIQREVQKVKFVKGILGGKHYGRIDGYIGKWELVKSILIPSINNIPEVCGLISYAGICLRDLDNSTTYVTHINTEHTQKVIEGDSNMFITSCASIDSNVIVCGKARLGCTGGSFEGCITLYDRQWKVIRCIPMNSSNAFARVYVDVDSDGMILAALDNQSNIYVINPADGKIVNTITMQGKVVKGEIQALSSGDIVMNTGNRELTVISRSGDERAILLCDEWRGRYLSEPPYRVDKLTDTLYITYWDSKRSIYGVDQVSCDGIIQAGRIVEYEQSGRSFFITNPCLVTPSGNLVSCNGDKFLCTERDLLYKSSEKIAAIPHFPGLFSLHGIL